MKKSNEPSNRSIKVPIFLIYVHYCCFDYAQHHYLNAYLYSINEPDIIVYNITSMYNPYVAALQLEVVLNFICAVVVRHLPFLSVSRQICRQTLPLQRDEWQKKR